jgi:hypothetical protein
MGMAFFMSDNFTDPVVVVVVEDEEAETLVALASDGRDTPHLVGVGSELLAGGKVAMGGATCL